MNKRKLSGLSHREFHGHALVSNVFGNDRQGLNMWHVIVEPGQSLEVHQHPCTEIYIVAGGGGLLTVGEETEAVNEGDCVFINSNESHAFVNNTNRSGKIIAVSYLDADAPHVRH